MTKIRRRLLACAASAALASAIAAPAALAADGTLPSTENGGTQGSTDLVVKIADRSEVHVPNDNLTFTVPSKINYVAVADGTLIGPSNAYIGLAYIENTSAYRAFVSAYQASAETGWNIVHDAGTVGSSTRNAVSVEIGPSGHERDLSEGGPDPAAGAQRTISGGTSGSKVSLDESCWDMRAKDAPGDESKVYLATGGSLANIDANINGAVKFATIDWYLTPGTRTS